MDIYWLIPTGLAAVVGIWIFHHRVMKEGDQGIKKGGRVLLHKPKERRESESGPWPWYGC